MKRAKLNKTKLRNLSCGFIYSRINYGSTDHDIILLIKASASITRISSLRVPVYNKMRENSITLMTQNWIFRSSSLFQSNCTHRSNEQVKRATYFYFPEMSWLLAEHKGRVLRAEGRSRYNRTKCRVLAKSNNLVFFSFDMVLKYIRLENVPRKHWLNPMGMPPCLAMGNDTIIAKQGNSLFWIVIKQVCYDTNNSCLPFSPESVLYFETSKHRNFLHFAI